MAAVATVTHTDRRGEHAVKFGTIALDNSYPTGGEALTISGLERANMVIFGDAGGYTPAWDAANQKVKMYYGDYDPAAAGPQVQVPNATDLSALTAIPFIAWGK